MELSLPYWQGCIPIKSTEKNPFLLKVKDSTLILQYTDSLTLKFIHNNYITLLPGRNKFLNTLHKAEKGGTKHPIKNSCGMDQLYTISCNDYLGRNFVDNHDINSHTVVDISLRIKNRYW